MTTTKQKQNYQNKAKQDKARQGKETETTGRYNFKSVIVSSLTLLLSDSAGYSAGAGEVRKTPVGFREDMRRVGEYLSGRGGVYPISCMAVVV